jgi:hypothetical protein
VKVQAGKKLERSGQPVREIQVLRFVFTLAMKRRTDLARGGLSLVYILSSKQEEKAAA